MLSQAHVLGVVSDTHGLVRPEVLAALIGSELIIHAGDIGGAAVLAELGRIAPVVAVRGNNDIDEWAKTLERMQRLRIEDVDILVLHDLRRLAADVVTEDIGVVISGHSHNPKVERRAGVLYLNPGAAGPRRFKLPVAVARLFVTGSQVEAELIEIAL